MGADVVDAAHEIKQLLASQHLKLAVEVDIAASQAGKFAGFTSKEALSAHLAAVRATERLDTVSVLLNAPRGESLDLPRGHPDDGGI